MASASMYCTPSHTSVSFHLEIIFTQGIFASAQPRTQVLASRMSKRASSSSHPDDMPPKMPRGGHKQKLAWAKEQERHQEPKSSSANFMLEKWCFGHMSTPLIQAIAACAVQDGCGHADLLVLAALGSHGKYPNNMHIELVNKLKPTALPESLSSIYVTYKYNRKKSKIVQMDQKILLPHQVCASIYEQHPDIFQDKILAGTGGPEKFWDAMKGNGMYEAHPVPRRAGHQ